jgi:hypothetical protein
VSGSDPGSFDPQAIKQRVARASQEIGPMSRKALWKQTPAQPASRFGFLHAGRTVALVAAMSCALLVAAFASSHHGNTPQDRGGVAVTGAVTALVSGSPATASPKAAATPAITPTPTAAASPHATATSPPPAHPSIASVQVGAYQSIDGTTSLTLPLNAPSTAGNLLVAIVADSDTADPSPVWGAPEGWQRVTETQQPGDGTAAIFFYPNNPGGISSVTFRVATLHSPVQGQISEWSGADKTSPLDAYGSAVHAGGDTSHSVSASGPTTRAGDLAITQFSYAGAPTTIVSGDGWTSAFADTQWGFASDYVLGIPAATTAAETETTSESAGDMIIIAVFRPAS